MHDYLAISLPRSTRFDGVRNSCGVVQLSASQLLRGPARLLLSDYVVEHARASEAISLIRLIRKSSIVNRADTQRQPGPQTHIPLPSGIGPRNQQKIDLPKESSPLEVGVPRKIENENTSLDASVSALLPPTLSTRWVPSLAVAAFGSGMFRVVEPSTAAGIRPMRRQQLRTSTQRPTAARVVSVCRR